MGQVARLLVVGASDAERVRLVEALREVGFAVESLADGAAAQAAHLAAPFDLIVADVELRGQDGYGLARAIRDRGDATPILLLTAPTDTRLIERGLASGAQSFLPKGAAPSVLRARIEELLAEHDQGGTVDPRSAGGAATPSADQRVLDDLVRSTRKLVASGEQVARAQAAARAAQESEKFLQSALDALSARILVLDGIGNVVAVNAAWGALAPEDLDGTARVGPGDSYLASLAELPDEGGRTLESGLRAVLSGTRESFAQTYPTTVAGAPRHVTMRVTRFPGTGPTFVVVAHEDETASHLAYEQLREKEEQLRQSQRLESVGRLAGGVAHDFNNLLTGIMGFGQFALRGLTEDDPRRQDLEQMLATAQRAADLTRQLLAFSRRQPLAVTVFDCNDVVRDLQKMLGRIIGEHIRLVIDLAPLPLRVMADRGQIEQVVVNLVVNARDAMPDGGTLTLRTLEVDLPGAQDASGAELPAGAHVRLEVADTGVGMAAETQAQAFEPFFTTKPDGQGTGLGLATVSGVVGQSHGRIGLESQLGRGTTVTVDLPAAEKTAETDVPRRASEPLARPDAGTVLVLEDDDYLREVVRRVLAEDGFTVHVAGEAEEALRVVETAGRNLDLLLTDVLLPGMNGVDCAARVRQQQPTLPVIFMTGYADLETLERIQDDPHAVLISKPFTPDRLVKTVRTALAPGDGA